MLLFSFNCPMIRLTINHVIRSQSGLIQGLFDSCFFGIKVNLKLEQNE